LKPRTPVAVARITGALTRNPGRFEGRAEPLGGPLGACPTYLGARAATAWAAFASELPWLQASDRALVEVASLLRARIMGGELVGIQGLTLLQSVLSKLGGTPCDRSRVVIPVEPEPPSEFWN